LNKDILYEYIKYLKNNFPSWINNKRIEFYFIPIFDSGFSNKNQKNITDVELYKFFIYLHSQGIKNAKSHAIFDFLINSLNGKSEIRSTIRCKDVVFGPDGKIYDCDLCDPITRIGDINTQTINKKKLMEHWKGQKFNIPKCKKCKYLFLCDGGDRLASLKKTDSPCNAMCDCYRKNFSLFYKLLLNPKKDYKGSEEIIKTDCLKKNCVICEK
jgi:radical SAM protein with 4Fe4S-binding SPASM domain